MSARVKVPADTSSVLPEPTVTLEVAMVDPSIVPPLMSALVAVKLVMVMAQLM